MQFTENFGFQFFYSLNEKRYASKLDGKKKIDNF